MDDKTMPYVLYMAEIIYKNIVYIKSLNKNINNEDAINKFMQTDLYENLRSGKLHDDFLNKLKNNNFIDKNNRTKISNETIKLLNIQRDIMIKQLIRFPTLYDNKNHNLLELSTRAYRLIFRMCESYELWCRESKQENLITLKVID